MQNHILDDYLDAIKLQLRALRLSDRRRVLDEIRDHLVEDAAARRKEDKKLSEDEALLQATHDFGDPKDIGIAYGAEGGVVRRSTGEVVLHVAVLTGRGVARTVGKTLKWGGISLGLLLLVAVVVGTTIFLVLAVTYQPTIEKSLDKATSYATRSLVERQDSADRETTMFQDSFTITNQTVDSELQIQVKPVGTAPDGGCMTVTITGPGDEILYDSTGDCGNQDFKTSYTNPGTYRIQYRLVYFTGTYSVHGYATERIDGA